MGLELILFFTLVFMASLGYAGAYIHMHKEIRMREIEIEILHMYINQEMNNENKRTVRV